MGAVELELRRHRGDYGFDGSYRRMSAPGQVGLAAAIVLALVAAAAVAFGAGVVWLGAVLAFLALWLVLTVLFFVRTTRVGKFEVWARILAGLDLRGDEELLDLGCGRGAVLLSAAKLLPRGRAVGIDLWRPDQTGNSAEATRRNAELEGVADRASLHTGDITRLPFRDASFDVVTSNLVIHNIPDPAARLAAIDEAVRVLRPGGRLVIADLWSTNHYAARLREAGLTAVGRRNLGWRMWWGPFVSTHLVTATKSAG